MQTARSIHSRTHKGAPSVTRALAKPALEASLNSYKVTAKADPRAEANLARTKDSLPRLGCRIWRRCSTWQQPYLRRQRTRLRCRSNPATEPCPVRTQPLDRWAPIGFLTHAPQLRTHPSSTHLLCPCKPSYQRARCTCSYQKQPEPCPPMLRRRRPQTKKSHAIGNQTLLPLLWRAGHRAQSPSTGPEAAAGAGRARRARKAEYRARFARRWRWRKRRQSHSAGCAHAKWSPTSRSRSAHRLRCSCRTCAPSRSASRRDGATDHPGPSRGANKGVHAQSQTHAHIRTSVGAAC